MHYVAIKNLLQEKGRFIASVGGVSFSILLILALVGVYYGSISQARAMPLNSGANAWVVQNGASDLFHTYSILPGGLEKRIKKIKGVKKAEGVINHPTQIKVNGRQITMAVFGYDTRTGLGGPWKIYEGTSDIKRGEAVVDRSFAVQNGLEIGDKINIGETVFKVAGTSIETNSLVFQYIFITFDDAKTALNQEKVVNYYLMDVEKSDLGEATKEIEGLVFNSAVKSPVSIADANERVVSESFLPIIELIVVIGLLVGSTVIGLTIYSATMEKVREFSILKAVGSSSFKLYQVVFYQSLMSGVLGYAIGLILFTVLTFVAFNYLPIINFKVTSAMYLFVFVGALLMSLLSSYIPLRKVLKIDPAEVFD